MKKSKKNYLLDYFPPILILSYFFIHNIFLVIIGTLVSIYIININSINSLLGFILKNLNNKKSTKELNKNNNEFTTESANMKFEEYDTNISLVEIIEEFGFIPSLDKTDDSKSV